MTEPREATQGPPHGYCPCLWPKNRWGLFACVAALVLVGGFWLLSNLGWILDPWWELMAPALLIAWGAATLLTSRSLR